MGQSYGKGEIVVWVIGHKDSGKTHLIDFLKYGGDTTKFSTKGCYIESYIYQLWTLKFIELGGGHSFAAQMRKRMQHLPSPHCIYWIVTAQDTIDNLYASRNLLLFTLQMKGIDAATPIVMIYNRVPSDYFNLQNKGDIYTFLANKAFPLTMEDENQIADAITFENLYTTLQLDRLGSNRGFYRTELSFPPQGDSLTKLLQWTIEHHLPTPTVKEITLVQYNPNDEEDDDG